MQATDQYVAVRNARIVLSDDNQLRAATTAIRLQDMGHDVYLLDADARAGTSDASGFQQIGVNTIQFEALPQANHARGLKILDASPGMQFREAHIDGAVWVTRARLDRLALAPDEDVLVTGHDVALIEGIVIELNVLGFTNVHCSKGSLAIWMNAGYTVISTPDEPSDDECIDYLFFVHDRHDGNMDAARRYLAWEVGLIDQLDAQERSVLNPRTQFMSE